MAIRNVTAALNRLLVQRQLLQRPLRGLARLRIAGGLTGEGQATIVIVNWNSGSYLDVVLGAVERFTDPPVRIIVVDNASADESKEVALSHPNVRFVRLPRNVGHGTAEDIGFLLARTEFVISLDVDAFPIAAGWRESLLAPLRDGYSVSGAHLRGGFVHPCCLAMRTADFVRRRHTFTPRYGHGDSLAVSAEDTSAAAWDVGQSISLREDRRYLFDRTRVRGPGDIGSEWAGLIYHNFYSTRFGSKLPPRPEEEDLGVNQAAALAAWEEAVGSYLGGTHGGTPVGHD